jgi:hypothetical protein
MQVAMNIVQCFKQNLTLVDTAEQKKNFAENPLEYQNYCKQIEDELNKRFRFILNGTPEAKGAKDVRDS